MITLPIYALVFLIGLGFALGFITNVLIESYIEEKKR